MTKKIATVLFLILATQIQAQFIKKKSIDASIGLGATLPNDNDTDLTGSGFYLQGEYVLKVSNWLDLRPYAGVVFTKTDDDENTPEEFEASTNAFLIGGKVRAKIPIPWVSPFIELGIGASLGSFKTITNNSNIDESGLIAHIPFSLGLEVGKKHNIDIAFLYYFQNSVEQITGAAALGITIPLEN